ncbi:MAG TPA: aminotransferase class I/II-fold pyridoxal phosphate-dependent enzyme, partial [Solirubrobacteraceae bacterium]|nr:aminotransferase class I/II-fold pyridoxal phosphate-dependent enzyme [Solirubrobacteraceae bacterium]
CVLFGSGYLANLGAIGALAGPGDAIFSDALNHASIVDGCRLSGARINVYRHLDSEHLAWSLRRDGGGGRRLVVTDSVFSMDGDLAPLAEIVRLAREHGARLLVDEAHATGALGPGGRGAVAAAGLEPEVDVLVGTLGKALGTYGAYVCADAPMVRYLVNRARPLIFSTAPAPPAVAGALAALELLEEHPQRVARLRARARTLRGALAAEGFAVPAGEMQIVPLLAGDERAALGLCEGALQRGVFAQAIRPPSVPAGTSRLRLTATAAHAEDQLRHAARVLGEAARAAGLDPRSIGVPRGDGPSAADGRPSEAQGGGAGEAQRGGASEAQGGGPSEAQHGGASEAQGDGPTESQRGGPTESQRGGPTEAQGGGPLARAA